MVTKKRIQEIKNSESIIEQTDKELNQTIEEGERMSRENNELFSNLLS